MWPAIISAGAQVASSILPKLFGGGSHNQIKSIVGDARKAGIHPLYALGGSGAFGGSGYAGPEISWGDAAGAGLDAIGRAADVFDAENQARADREERRAERDADRRFQSSQAIFDREFQREMRKPSPLDEAQRALLEAQTRTELLRQKALMQGASGGGNVSDPNTPIRLPFGITLDTNAAGMSPAQTWQNEYGDLVESIYGIGKLGADVGTNLYNWASRGSSVPHPVGQRRPLPY